MSPDDGKKFIVRKCLRCGHEWKQRHPEHGVPRQCPNCKSPRWQQPISTPDDEAAEEVARSGVHPAIEAKILIIEPDDAHKPLSGLPFN